MGIRNKKLKAIGVYPRATGLYRRNGGFPRENQSGESVRDFETIRRKKDGTGIPVSLTVSPSKTPSGDIIGASIITRDIH